MLCQMQNNSCKARAPCCRRRSHHILTISKCRPARALHGRLSLSAAATRRARRAVATDVSICRTTKAGALAQSAKPVFPPEKCFGHDIQAGNWGHQKGGANHGAQLYNYIASSVCRFAALLLSERTVCDLMIPPGSNHRNRRMIDGCRHD